MAQLSLNSPWRNRQDDRKSSYDQRSSHKRRKCYAAPTSRELPTNNPILALEVAVEANNKDKDRDADESRAERFAHATKTS